MTDIGEEVLVDGGLSVLVRPIDSDDKRRLADTFERLSPETRYRRFFAPLQRLSEQDLRYLTEIDHRDHEALVAVDPEDDGIIAVARYVRSHDPREAEVAIVVVDPWQQKGVATALLERLVSRAREAGIHRFVALVLSDNQDALELFHHLAHGRTRTRSSDPGEVEMLIELPEPGGGLSESRLGRVLSAVAREAPRVNPWPVLREAIRRRP